MKKTIVFNIRVEPEQHEFIKKVAHSTDRSMGQVIRLMIEQFMAEMKTEK